MTLSSKRNTLQMMTNIIVYLAILIFLLSAANKKTEKYLRVDAEENINNKRGNQFQFLFASTYARSKSITPRLTLRYTYT